MRIGKHRRNNSKQLWMEKTPAFLQLQEQNLTSQRVSSKGTAVAEVQSVTLSYDREDTLHAGAGP